jgi:exopolysaccharide biosynthesis predicted pyruvyltransferase EpsI
MRRVAEASTLAQAAMTIICTNEPALARLPCLAEDISDPSIATFERFCDLIVNAAAIFTDRLHVGILGALLDKPTYICSGNNHKIHGVVSLSLNDMPHVKLIDHPDRRRREGLATTS